MKFRGPQILERRGRSGHGGVVIVIRLDLRVRGIVKF